MLHTIAILSSVIVAACNVSFAQEYSSADIKILSNTRTPDEKTQHCLVTVHNDNDDDARDGVLVVLLPIHVTFVSSSGGASACIPSPQISAWNGFVTCGLGNMAVGQEVTVDVQTSLPPPEIQNASCGAFVYSQVPDWDRSNNYHTGAGP